MPAYLPPRKGVSISQAFAEAAAVAPISRAMLHTFELWHPTMTEPVRVVNNYEPLMATLEGTAPRDAGDEVEFMAAVVWKEEPEESDAAAEPETSLSIDNVSGFLKQALDRARGSRDLWEVIERIYASDDTTGPASTPVLKLTFTEATMSGGTATLVTSYGDPVNTGIPALTIKPEEYPGLSAR